MPAKAGQSERPGFFTNERWAPGSSPRAALISFACLRFAGLVAIARGLNPIPFRTRPLNSSAPMILRLKTRESRSLPGLPSADEFLRTFSSRSFKRKAPPFGAAFSFVGRVGAEIYRREASNRNHARRSASSIQVSIRLVVATSPSSSASACASRRCVTDVRLSSASSASMSSGVT